MQTQFDTSATEDILKHCEQFLLLSPISNIYTLIKESFYCFSYMLSKSSAANLMYVGKG